jgi:glucosyl-dolichyl phosphate glucuronosyltransferase
MDNRVQLSVIVCTYNRARYLPDTLGTLADQTLDTSLYEIVLVDNNSTDETAEVVADFQVRQPHVNLQYVHESTQGLSVARNRGIDVARAGLLAFLDDDIYADHRYVQTVLDFFDRTEDAVAAGGRIIVHFDAPRPDWMSPFLMPLLGEHHPATRVQPYPRRLYPFGGKLCVRRSVLDCTGGFYPSLGRSGSHLLGSEEKEFFHRLRRCPGRLYYIPDAIILHRVDEARLSIPFVRRQAIGIGLSERIRVKGSGWGAILLKAGEECIKAGGTFVIALAFLCTLRTSAGAMLLKFRFWVIRGLLGFNG